MRTPTLAIVYAYLYSGGDERLAMAITAIDRANDKEMTMRTPEAEQAITRAKQYLQSQEGDVQAIGEALSATLPMGDPFRTFWANSLDLIQAEERGEIGAARELMKNDIAQILGITENDAQSLARVLVEIGAIRMVRMQRKEGVKKGTGRQVFAFDKTCLERISRSLQRLVGE